MSDRLNSMWAAHQTTKIIHLCLQTVKSGSNKGSLPIDPIHRQMQCQLSPLEGSLAQARGSSWDSLRAGTASLQFTAQLSHSAAQRLQPTGNFTVASVMSYYMDPVSSYPALHPCDRLGAMNTKALNASQMRELNTESETVVAGDIGIPVRIYRCRRYPMETTCALQVGNEHKQSEIENGTRTHQHSSQTRLLSEPMKPDPGLLMEPVKYHRFKNPCVINIPGSPASIHIIPFRNSYVQYMQKYHIDVHCRVRRMTHPNEVAYDEGGRREIKGWCH
ncbi:hypothetical protein PAMA_020708 [Pampus argenteus]